MLLSYPFSSGGAGSVFSFRFPDMGQIDFELKTPLGGVLKRIRPNPPPSYCGTSIGRENSLSQPASWPSCVTPQTAVQQHIAKAN